MQGIDYGFEMEGDVRFNIKEINEGFEIARRQYAMQNYEGYYVGVWGKYNGLGSDKEYGRDVHVSFNNIDFYNEYVDHIWLQYVAFANPQVWMLLKRNDFIYVYGKVYSYISNDKKYSIKPEWIYNPNIGWHYIDMKNLYRTR